MSGVPQHGGLTPQGFQKTLAEPPYEDLKKLAESGISEVMIYLKRWNDKGKVLTLKNRMCTIGDILTDGLADQLRDEFGGGSYMIHVRDINDPATDLCQRFMINVVGQMRTPLSMTNTPGLSGLPSGGVPSQPQMVAGFRYGEMNGGGGAVRPHEVASYTSDAIAMQTANELREELKQARRDAGNREKVLQQKLDQFQATMEQQRIEADRKSAEMRDNMLRAEIAGLKEKYAQPVKPAFDLTALIAGIGALVPIFTAMITTSKDRQQIALDAQKHSSEQQFQMLMSLLKKPEGKDPALELVMGLIPKLLEARDPSKQADVLTALADSQMSSLHMTAQIMKDLAPEPDSPIMALAREVISGVMNVVETAQQKPLPQPQQHPQLQPSQQQAHAQVVPNAPAAAVHATQGRQPRPSARSAPPQQVRTARDLATIIVNDPQWPADMKGPVWIRLLTTLHSEQDPEEIGGEIGLMLEGLEKIKGLAPALQPMFEDDGPAPSTLVRPFFDLLPIGQLDHKERYEAILRAIDAAYDVETPVASNGNGHTESIESEPESESAAEPDELEQLNDAESDLQPTE